MNDYFNKFWPGSLLLFATVVFHSCCITKPASAKLQPIDLFKQIIVGNFDNSKQVAEEISAGRQKHPLAKHVNREASTRIAGLPDSLNAPGFWIVEETYYTWPGKPVELKPFLFYFSPAGKDSVQLRVFQFPASMNKEEIRNDNDSLVLNFQEIKPSPTFRGAYYVYRHSDSSFYTNTSAELGKGMRFTLTETLTPERLTVMELLEKEGKRITAYDTPIVYNRK
jgi:hypothetical protein